MPEKANYQDEAACEATSEAAVESMAAAESAAEADEASVAGFEQAATDRAETAAAAMRSLLMVEVIFRVPLVVEV